MNTAATTKTTALTTWSAANKVAEEISLAELHALLAADRAPTIFPGEGKQRLHAFGAFVMRGCDRAIGYEQCDRNGWTVDGPLLVGGSGGSAPVFAFHSLARIVRVAPVAR